MFWDSLTIPLQIRGLEVEKRYLCVRQDTKHSKNPSFVSTNGRPTG